MKILFFARRYYPDIGGVEKHVAMVSSELKKKQHTVTVVAECACSETLDAKKVYPVSINGVEVYKIQPGSQNWFKKFRLWKSLWQLRRVIKEADVIHCHDVFFWYLPFRFLFPAKPIFVTFHGYEKYPVSLKEIIVRKIAEKLSWGNICIGEFIRKWYKTKPSYVSYGATLLPKRNIPAAARLSALFIGRLEKNTGIAIYNEAVVQLMKQVPTFSMLAVGAGRYEQYISKKIKRIGTSTNPQQYYAKNRFVFASGYLSILESFVAQRLVFAVYDNPLKRDYLTMTPFRTFIIIVSSAEELVEKMTYYIKHPNEEKKLVTAAYTWASAQSWEKLTEIYLRLWKMEH